jgi:hypothetical protein
MARGLVEQRKAIILSVIFFAVEENSQDNTPCRENDVPVC